MKNERNPAGLGHQHRSGLGSWGSSCAARGRSWQEHPEHMGVDGCFGVISSKDLSFTTPLKGYRACCLKMEAPSIVCY